MTDQPVQPEATTKAGQAMEAWLREPENYEWGRKVTNAILAIEAEAVAASQERPPIGRNPYLETSPKRIAWEYGYAAGLGAASQERPPLMVDGLAYDEVVTERAASQERPHTTEADALLREWVEHHQPEGYEGIQDCSDINDRTEAYLAAAPQERPPIDVDWRRVSVRVGELIWRRANVTPAEAHAIATDIYALLAGGSVASPEPTE
jgi:hypothetical protein